MQRIVVTGIGAVTPFGVGMSQCFNSLIQGKSAIQKLESSVFEKCKCQIGAPVPKGEGNNNYNPSKYNVTDKATQPNVIGYAVAAASDAIDDAHIDIQNPAVDKGRIGISFSCNIEEIDSSSNILDRGKRLSPFFVPRILNNLPASNVSIRFGLQGPCVSNNMACASSGYSIIEGLRSLRLNEIDTALVGGTESCIGRLGFFGFSAMHALSSHSNDSPKEGSCPFDLRRNGFVMGEGSVVMVLEPYEKAVSRGATIYVMGERWLNNDGEIVDGYSNCDGYHITSPIPDGHGAMMCMKSLLNKTGVKPEEIGYLSAHATSTQIGDKAEMLAIRDVFGNCKNSLHISSTKGATGHLLGAAGVLEAAICLYALKEGVLPPTLNLENTDIDFGFDLIPKTSLKQQVEYAISNSFGFGGVNVSLLFKKCL